jgi:hypothetical protein
MLARVGESHSYGTRAAQWAGGKYGVQDPDGMGDLDREVEGDCVGGGLQAELDG